MQHRRTRLQQSPLNTLLERHQVTDFGKSVDKTGANAWLSTEEDAPDQFSLQTRKARGILHTPGFPPQALIVIGKF